MCDDAAWVAAIRLLMAQEEEFQWTLERFRDLTRERLTNLRTVEVKARIWEHKNGHMTFRYFFLHGFVECHDFPDDGDLY